jgi:hypothetical protein
MTGHVPDARLVFKTHGPLDPTIDSLVCVSRPELDQLIRLVQAPTVDAYLAILGARQTGKTTLLHQLRARLRPRGFGVALIDLAPVREQTEPELYRFVAGKILSDLESIQARQDKSHTTPRLPTNPVEFREFLLETARQTRSMRLVMMIDNVDAVPAKYADTFFGALRNVFTSRREDEGAELDKYLFIFSGSNALHQLTEGNNSPLDIAERIYLHDLDLTGVRILALNFKRATIAAPEMAAQWIYEQTTGHPYLTQKLCSIIEQAHPSVITPDIVRKASVQILKGDDHLQKLLQDIDADGRARPLLEQIVRGKPVPFSRSQPAVARLELLGAIRDNGQCAVRNAIYYAAFRSHLSVANGIGTRRDWLRGLVAVAAFLIFLVNLPLLFSYAADILFATRIVNDQLVSSNLGSNVIIHYDRILQANSAESSTISVYLDRPPPGGPITVTFKPDTTDITLEGSRQRQLSQPLQQEHLTFFLKSGLGALRYNPFNPATDHRRITLLFEKAGRGVQLEAYTADFLVDNFSPVIISAIVSLASLIAGFGVLFSTAQRFRHLLRFMERLADRRRAPAA